jgi:hypothetical protein
MTDSPYCITSGRLAIGMGWVAIAIVAAAMIIGSAVTIVRVNDATIVIFSIDGLKVCDVVLLSCRRLNTLVPKQ